MAEQEKKKKKENWQVSSSNEIRIRVNVEWWDWILKVYYSCLSKLMEEKGWNWSEQRPD